MQRTKQFCRATIIATDILFKRLVIPRRWESTPINIPRSGQNLGIDSLCGDLLVNWIPAFAGMTSLGANGQSGLNKATESRHGFPVFDLPPDFPVAL